MAKEAEDLGSITRFPTQIFRHIVEKNHDDWKYSYESSIGPTDNRHVIKTRGDDQATVIKEHNAAIGELGAKAPEKKEPK